MEVTDENECDFDLNRCALGQANCVNQLGTYTCICDDGLVDWSSANGDRAGIDCRDPCNNGTEWCLNSGECINAKVFKLF